MGDGSLIPVSPRCFSSNFPLATCRRESGWREWHAGVRRKRVPVVVGDADGKSGIGGTPPCGNPPRAMAADALTGHWDRRDG